MSKHLWSIGLICIALPAVARTDFEPLDCVIEPNVVVEISSAVEGVIETVHVERNDTVEKGQTLVELHSSVERATMVLAKARAEIISEVEANRASLALRERQHDRIDRLYRRRILGRKRSRILGPHRQGEVR